MTTAPNPIVHYVTSPISAAQLLAIVGAPVKLGLPVNLFARRGESKALICQFRASAQGVHVITSTHHGTGVVPNEQRAAVVAAAEMPAVFRAL